MLYNKNNEQEAETLNYHYHRHCLFGGNHHLSYSFFNDYRPAIKLK